jgi:prolyl-tRNA synthetase
MRKYDMSLKESAVDQRKRALSRKRSEGFSEWYQEVIRAAELADVSSVRGCMVMMPYGFAIWERVQLILDAKFKELGHTNCYFPMLIPIDLFEKESEHVEGFAKEMAIVTHHRLGRRDGKLVPESPLEVPLAIRPTSEMIIGESMARWIKSYRDLPIMINQWCNVMRWEMRTRPFLRTSEFLWQEGHTAHETEAEAIREARTMHDVYYWFIRDILKMQCFRGSKPDHDRFAGAVETLSIEVMMQDGKALQAATSHYLGQNFSKAVGIHFQGRDEREHLAFTTSWGLSTRIIGGIIMCHSDDDGLNLPSAVAPYHVVIIPITRDRSQDDGIMEYCHKVKMSLQKDVRVHVDTRETQPQDKRWNYIRKGVPVICEIGMREVENEEVSLIMRACNLEKLQIKLSEFAADITQMLEKHDSILSERNEDFFKKHIKRNVNSFEELKGFFDGESGFVIAKWSGSTEGIERLKEMAVSIRCIIPFEQERTSGRCVLTGSDSTMDAVFAKSY